RTTWRGRPRPRFADSKRPHVNDTEQRRNTVRTTPQPEVSSMHSFRQDIRFALRTFRNRPALATHALAMIALGIGANAAIFSFVNAVLLRPLPYPEPDLLVQVMRAYPKGNYQAYVSVPNFRDWRDQSTDSFESM